MFVIRLSHAAFRLACRLATLMMIFVHLRKLHLPLRDDQVASSILPINDLAALPTVADHIQLTLIQLDSNAALQPMSHCGNNTQELIMNLQAVFVEQSGKASYGRLV